MRSLPSELHLEIISHYLNNFCENGSLFKAKRTDFTNIEHRQLGKLTYTSIHWAIAIRSYRFRHFTTKKNSGEWVGEMAAVLRLWAGRSSVGRLRCETLLRSLLLDCRVHGKGNLSDDMEFIKQATLILTSFTSLQEIQLLDIDLSSRLASRISTVLSTPQLLLKHFTVISRSRFTYNFDLTINNQRSDIAALLPALVSLPSTLRTLQLYSFHFTKPFNDILPCFSTVRHLALLDIRASKDVLCDFLSHFPAVTAFNFGFHDPECLSTDDVLSVMSTVLGRLIALCVYNHLADGPVLPQLLNLPMPLLQTLYLIRDDQFSNENVMLQLIDTPNMPKLTTLVVHCVQRTISLEDVAALVKSGAKTMLSRIFVLVETEFWFIMAEEEREEWMSDSARARRDRLIEECAKKQVVLQVLDAATDYIPAFSYFAE